MLVQDHLTGLLHEVADDGVQYDGFGNPVGFPPLLPILGTLAPIAAQALPGIMKAIGLNGEDLGDYSADELNDDIPQGRVVYDGFGNPVGFAPIFDIVKNIIPGAARAIAPIAQSAMQAITQGPQQIMRALSPGFPAPPVPAPAFPVPAAPTPFAPPAFFPRPPGWQHAPVPYTGPRPARAYMRCSVWPGPRGLVPIATGTDVTPGAPGAPSATVTPAAVVRRRRRRRR